MAFFRRTVWLNGSERQINVHGSVYRKNILIYIQQDATFRGLFYLETSLRVSGGTFAHHQERIQLCSQTVIATCRYSGRWQ